VAGRVVARQLAVGDQVHQHVVLEHLDGGRGAHALDQRGLHGRAGGVGRVHDAPVAVATLAREVQFAVLEREGHAELLQPGDRGGRVFHRELRGFEVAQAGAGHQRVFHVRGHAVALGQHGGDAALGPVARAVAERALGDHRHAVGAGQVQRGGEPGQAAADDEDVEAVQIGHEAVFRKGCRRGARRWARRPLPA
jgi:hypothetical protein